MAQYQITWRETRITTVTINAPENDERMLEAAVNGDLVKWAKADLMTGAVVGVGPFLDPEVEVTALGKVKDGQVHPL